MRRHPFVILLLAGFVLAASAIAVAQFRLPQPRVPDVGDILRDQLDLRIPDLRGILDEPPALSSSFDDAVTGVPFLDDLDPAITAPMCQLPFSGDGAFIVALPGMYELRARSYCLHAGAHGPGSGEGYLYAPLQGKLADVIQSVLDQSMMHPEVAQDRVQSLIWAIEAHAKVSEMSPELRDAADVLLTREQIHRLNGGALGMIPEELFDQAFVDVPDEARMVLEAQARLRQRLQQEVYDFDALQDIAVLAGEPEDEGGPIVPRGRWSWTPDGFFVRYFPHSYPDTTIQLYAPEAFSVVTDAAGRISEITNRYGGVIQALYADADAADVAGDVRAHTLASLRLVTPTGEAIELACSPDDLVLTGLPGGGGGPGGDVGALYQVAAETMQQVREIADHVPGASADPERMTALADLAQFTDAFERVTADAGDAAPRLRNWLNMARMACASELTVLLGSAPVGGSPTAARPPTLDGVRLALLPLTSVWQAPVRDGDGLPWFRPSRGGAMPASRGRQRLGTSGGSRELPDFRPDPRPRDDDDEDDDSQPSGGDGKGAYNRAKKAIDWFQKGKQAVDVATDPAGAAAGITGFGIPESLFGKILDFNFDAWGRASKALGSDPPRDDFTEMAIPQAISLPALQAADALSAEHAAALNALAAAVADNLAIVRAAQLCEDRMAGALAAGEDDWAMTQAAALIDYKHQAGAGMMTISRRLDDVMDAIRAAGVPDYFITEAAVEAYQDRLRDEGWSAEELQAAQLLGISDGELAQMRAERLAADPAELAGSMMQYWDELADSLWWLGKSWRNLPALQP